MKAVVMRGQRLLVDEIAMPEPGPGEVLVKTLACGICGSDLHTLRHAEHAAAALRRSGSPLKLDLSRDLVMGHEFCAEIVDYGPEANQALKPGTKVCSVPFVLRPSGSQLVGYSHEVPGGYGEYMILMEPLLLEVPAGLPPSHAALTEPMAVGLHAVVKARMERNDVPLVIGCGPIGLAVIAALRLKDVHPIVAADFSSRRREIAEAMGAHLVVDPAVNSPYESWNDVAARSNLADAPTLPPWIPGPPRRPAVIFECVGIPGIIDQIMAASPPNARIVVVGVCMERDHFEPLYGINKELNVQFVFAYTLEEYAATLYHIADERIAIEPLLTGKLGIRDVPAAFEELASPEKHAKIIVEPWR